MYFSMLGILFLTGKLQASEINSTNAIVNGSSIPGQGYVYVPEKSFLHNYTRKSQIWIKCNYFACVKGAAKVACKMAGCAGPSSPSMAGFLLSDWKWIPSKARYITNIYNCRGNELSLLLCRKNNFGDFVPLMVNCLPPGPSHEHGVFYNLWKVKNFPTGFYESRWKHSPLLQNKPISSQILPSFNVWNLYRDNLIIKLRAYLMVNHPGDYSIGAACSRGCEVWWKRVQEPGLDVYETSDMIIKIASTGQHNNFERSSKQSSNINIACHLYHLEVYAKLQPYENFLSDSAFANIAIKTHAKNKWSPIPTDQLYWNRPGSRELHFSLTENITSQIHLGSKLLIKALYMFCCVGLRCPSCPLTLHLHALDQNLLVNRSLQMDCREYLWKYSIDVIQQPKRYAIEISYYLNGDVRSTIRRTVVKSVQVSESTLYSCTLADPRRHGCVDDWKVFYIRNLTISSSKEVCPTACFCNGIKQLKSPPLPWKDAFRNISLCVSFSYRLPSQGLSRLEVYVLMKSKNQQKWSIKGYQGESWKSGSIPIIRAKEKFKILFNISSTINKTICGIRSFRLSSSECELSPKHAEPGYRCLDSQYQCNSGECIDKYKRCNGIKGDCIDGSDEIGCACVTGEFTCLHGSCADTTKLCNGILDCKKGEDEMRCDEERQDCPGYKCIDGRCPTSASPCEDIMYNISECWSSNKEHANLCRGQNANCETAKGICGFDAGPCGMKSYGWNYNSPTNKNYKSFDHSFIKGGSYYIASHRNNQSTASIFSIQWNKTKPYCMQFWHIVPAKASMNVCFSDISNSTICMWNTSSTIRDEWTFGQVELPSAENGIVQIVGDAKRDFPAIDDLNFIQTTCPQVIAQTNPSCYFDHHQSCNVKIDRSWVQTMYKDIQGENSFYLSLGFPNNESNKILSTMISSKSDGWKCVRFWMSSVKKYSSRKLDVFYNSQNGSIPIFSTTSLTPGWVYLQSPIPGDRKPLQVVIEGKRDIYSSLSVDDISYTKYHCQGIPDLKSGKECIEYRTLDGLDRRKDQKGSFDSYKIYDAQILSTSLWYRIAGQAGNQVSTECAYKRSYFACYGYDRQVWINGIMPSVAQGQVLRTVCEHGGGSVGYKTCCGVKSKVNIRNCGGYFVYRFLTLGKYQTVCTEYSARNLTIGSEWKNWTNILSGLRWKILSDKEFISISKSIEAEQGLQRGVEVSFNSSALFVVPIKPGIESFSTCFWISSNTTTPKLVNIALEDMSLESFVCWSIWSHICVSFQYDIYVIYVDGVANETVYSGKKQWKLNSGIKFSITSSDVMNIKLTGLNAWDKFLDEDTILYMSYNCRNQRGNMVIWEEFVKNISTVTSLNDSVILYNKTSCEGRKGHALSVVSNATTPSSAKATYVSPLYPLPLRLVKSPASCLRFQYRMWGPGARVLKLYQVLDDKRFSWRPIWMDENSTSNNWKEGQVTISAVTEYQIAIEGEMSNAQGLISIGALYTTEEYCAVLPSSADKACNEVFTNVSGVIMSPCYPSYYSNNASCNSTIVAKPGYIVRLDIVEFELEMNTRCENDSVDVYDGGARIGRYCGIRYPPIIQSITNHVSVIFRSNAKIHRTGFRAQYRILKDNDTNQECLQDCPTDCECRKLSDGRIVVSSRSINAVPRQLPRKTSVILFSGNKISHIKTNTFKELEQLSLIDLSYNRIITMDNKAFFSLPSLHTLRLNMNFIRKIEDETWSKVETLQILDIGENLIASIGSRTLVNFNELKALSLRGNLITSLHVDAFKNNTKLNSLYLHDNHISNIPGGLFRNQRQLRVLYLHNNKIESFSKSSFRGLSMLEKLTLNNNTIKERDISRDAFSGMQNLKYLKIDSFILCCYAKKTVPTLIECESEENGFSSCEDMLKSIVIRVGIWVQGLFASFGNLGVIIWWTVLGKKQNTTRNKSNVQSLLLRHLGLADFLMGIYLLFIAVEDVLTKGEYVDHDVEWRSGITCKITGAISTLSSEVSVMMLVVLTADRFSTIVFDFKGKSLNLKYARCVCLIVWITGAFIAFIPVFATSYFNDEATGFSFYGRSTVCIPFQLSSNRPAGWEYSVAVFMAFNCAAFLFILVAYVAIFIKVQRSAKRVQSSREPSSLGTKIMFIVMTDFCCWMPVIVLGILSLTGHFNDPTGQVYAMIAVFVLPVNSSINPIIYTFATPQAKKLYHQMMQGLRDKFQKLKVKRNRKASANFDNIGFEQESQKGIQLTAVRTKTSTIVNDSEN